MHMMAYISEKMQRLWSGPRQCIKAGVREAYDEYHSYEFQMHQPRNRAITNKLLCTGIARIMLLSNEIMGISV